MATQTVSRPLRARPLRAVARGGSIAGPAVLGVAATVCLTVAMCAFYTTIPHQSLGRVNDFLVEAMPSLRQLGAGHLLAFLRLAPAYVDSLILRAPFAIGAERLHGTWQAVYGATAVPCVIAAPLLGGWLHATGVGVDGAARWRWLSPLGVLLIINPVFLYCLVMGHPEDVLSAALAIAGVVLAVRDRATLGLVLIAIATADKEWALVALPVAIVAMPRVRAVPIAACLMTLAVSAVPLFAGHPVGGATVAASTGTIFMSTQLWWFLGPHFPLVAHAHELIVVLAAGLALIWRVRDRGPAGDRDRLREVLWLLALVLLLRSALDPWNNIYYHLPFLMTIFALEVGRPPRLSVALTVLVALVTIPFPTASLDLRALTYQAAVVPLILAVGARVFLAPANWEALLRRVRGERAVPASR